MALEEQHILKVLGLLRSSLLCGGGLEVPLDEPLSDYETRPGFLSLLMDIIRFEEHKTEEVRRLASIYLERTILLYWGNRSFISDREKTNLRDKLLSLLREENDQIAETLVNIISKIACFDYPRKWPELFYVLAQQLEKGDLLTSHRILEVFSHTIPALPGKDLRAEILSRLFDYCWRLWKEDREIVHNYLIVSNFIKMYPRKRKSIEENPFEAVRPGLTFERWSLCLSIIQMLTILEFRGVAKFVKVPPATEVCRVLIVEVASLVPIYSISPHHIKLSSVHKFCVNMMEGFVEIQKWYSTTLGDETISDGIVMFCWDTIMNSKHAKSPLLEQLLIKCMVMLRSVLSCIRNQVMYDLRNLDGKRIITRPMKGNIPTAVECLPSLRNECVNALCKILISRYFPLTENDLKEWSQDPEMFYFETSPSYHELDGDAKLRSHAEALFIEVFRNYRRFLGPIVIPFLQRAMNDRSAKETDSDSEMEATNDNSAKETDSEPQMEATNDRSAKETDSYPDIRLKEVAYTVVALLHDELFGKLDLKKLLEGVLHPELRNDHAGMRIIHWKLAFILQKWVLKVEGDMRKPVFCYLLRLLEYDDLVVKLAACQPLQYLAAKFDFQEEDSMDLLLSFLELCFKLLKTVRHFRSKNLVLHCILSGIINVGEKFQKSSGITKICQMIFPYANQLAYEIEEAWAVSIVNMNLKITVLQALRCLSELETLSPVCCKILRPILEMFSVSKDPNKLILLTYGMKLWESTISHALSINSQLLELFPYLQEVMKNTFDNYPRAMEHINDHSLVAIKIIDRYINLGGGRFLSENAAIIHKLLVFIYRNLVVLKRVRGLSKMDTGVFNFGASVADRLEALKGESNSDKLTDTKTSVEQLEDEKNIGALDKIKEKHGCSSSSEYSKMRVAGSVLFEDLKKLEEISIRSAGMPPAGQSVSAAVEELRETLLHGFVSWRITSN